MSFGYTENIHFWSFVQINNILKLRKLQKRLDSSTNFEHSP